MNTKKEYLASFLCLCCPITWAMEHSSPKKGFSTQVSPAQLGDFNSLKELCLRDISPLQIVALKKEYGNN